MQLNNSPSARLRRATLLLAGRANKFLPLLFVATTVSANNSDGIDGSEQLFGVWNNVFVSGKFAKDSKWPFWGVASLRTSQTNGHDSYTVAAMINQDAIGYQINPNNAVYLGYRFQWTHPPFSRVPVIENGAWQQHLYIRPTDYGTLQVRQRLDQRTVNISDEAAGFAIVLC